MLLTIDEHMFSPEGATSFCFKIAVKELKMKAGCDLNLQKYLVRQNILE